MGKKVIRDYLVVQTGLCPSLSLSVLLVDRAEQSHGDNCPLLGVFIFPLLASACALLLLAFSAPSFPWMIRAHSSIYIYVNKADIPATTTPSSAMTDSKSSPPLLQNYTELLQQLHEVPSTYKSQGYHPCAVPPATTPEKCQLPMIDLGPYTRGGRHQDSSEEEEEERRACAADICRASSEWGFFQVVNHGISQELLRRMREEQERLFEASFEVKATSGLLNNSYRWGTPTANCPSQFSWSEAFHIPLSKISDPACYGEFSSLREAMIELAAAMSELARLLIGILAENMGHSNELFDPMCQERTCFLRLNHYPACPVSGDTFGLVPHTDSDFLTILFQDQVSGLQLLKNSRWVAVEPNQEALIVNIGDLLQAWSNDVYKSVEHKVMANEKMERYTIAYFLCPSNESLIGSCREPSVFRRFTFGEYRHQVQEDVKLFGHKVGLSRFRIQQPLSS